MSDESQKIIEEQEKEIKHLKRELKKAVSLKSFGGVLIRTIKMCVQDILDREHKIKSQNERIKELEKELSQSNIKGNDDDQNTQDRDTASSECLPEDISSKANIIFEKCSFKALRRSGATTPSGNGAEEKTEHLISSDESNEPLEKEPQKDLTPDDTETTVSNAADNRKSFSETTASASIAPEEYDSLPVPSTNDAAQKHNDKRAIKKTFPHFKKQNPEKPSFKEESNRKQENVKKIQNLPLIENVSGEEIALENSALEELLPQLNTPDASMMDEEWDDNMVF